MKSPVAALFFGLTAATGRVHLESEASAATRGLPIDWTKASRSPSSHRLEMLFAVKQTNVGVLEDTLMKVSDPRSKDYGAHLTNEQVHALVRPLDHHVATVKHFLASHGATAVSVTPNSDFIRATVTVEMAEKMLSAEYYKLAHVGGTTVHRALSYSLPHEVAAAVDFVSPTVHIPTPPSRPRILKQHDQDKGLTNGPRVLRNLYSVGDVLGQAPANKMAVTAFLEQHYHEGDLQEFWKLFCDNGLVCGKGLPGLKGDETTGVGAGVEAMLDIESITGVAGNVTSEFWGFSGRSADNAENEPFLKWMELVSNTSDAEIPKLFSTSYGENEDSWSLDAATRLNTEFMKAGTRGISLLYASGDSGANCVSGRFTPQTPGSSPYVTAVGGTYLGGKEAIALSSGGFSDRWAQPDWQRTAVAAYLKTNDTANPLPPVSAGYNVSGRGYPDIAAQANDYTVVADGVPVPGVAGTSCAAPSASGIIALLNDARLVAGKSTLGFLNPWIYQNLDKWNDIVRGNNEGGRCGSAGGHGWPAVAGWDAATGAGSPNYAKLKATLGL